MHVLLFKLLQQWLHGRVVSCVLGVFDGGG